MQLLVHCHENALYSAFSLVLLAVYHDLLTIIMNYSHHVIGIERLKAHFKHRELRFYREVDVGPKHFTLRLVVSIDLGK